MGNATKKVLASITTTADPILEGHRDSDVVVVDQESERKTRYGIGGITNRGRLEHFVFGLAVVITSTPGQGTHSEMKRAREAGKVIDATAGDRIEIDGIPYRIVKKNRFDGLSLKKVRVRK